MSRGRTASDAEESVTERPRQQWFLSWLVFSVRRTIATHTSGANLDSFAVSPEWAVAKFHINRADRAIDGVARFVPRRCEAERRAVTQ